MESVKLRFKKNFIADACKHRNVDWPGTRCKDERRTDPDLRWPSYSGIIVIKRHRAARLLNYIISLFNITVITSTAETDFARCLSPPPKNPVDSFSLDTLSLRRGRMKSREKGRKEKRINASRRNRKRRKRTGGQKKKREGREEDRNGREGPREEGSFNAEFSSPEGRTRTNPRSSSTFVVGGALYHGQSCSSSGCTVGIGR